MKSYFPEHELENGIHNLVMPNRCGNRLTVLMHEDRMELEFLYKPNGMRRKDLRARTFSTRDVHTALFSSSIIAEMRTEWVTGIEYDPFISVVHTLSPTEARNTITFINVPDENCFGISAEGPLILAFRPLALRFERNGNMLTEEFDDRGERFVTFVKFTGVAANRYRILDDGTAVLQIFGTETVLIGAEDSRFQAERVIDELGSMNRERLVEHTQKIVAGRIGQGRIQSADPDVSRVLDLNKRVNLALSDEGGFTPGSLSRLYNILWVRDASMSSVTFALSGMPSYLRTWVGLALANPQMREINGVTFPGFAQMLGTRWGKDEDDGLFYVMWCCHVLYQMTGDCTPFTNEALDMLCAALDGLHTARFDHETGLYTSDSRGEGDLVPSPHRGYDIVNGKHWLVAHAHEGEQIHLCSSLYLNTGMYNALSMITILLSSVKPEWHDRIERYRMQAGELVANIRTLFTAPDGKLYTDRLIMKDGRVAWSTFDTTHENWEYAWSLTLLPFVPDLTASLKSARYVTERWPAKGPVGYCPWNWLASLLREYEHDHEAYQALMRRQLADALTTGKRFPMPGVLTEYGSDPESWRGIPFQTGSFIRSVCSQLLYAQAMSLAVRAGDWTDQIEDFRYRTARIGADAQGKGAFVDSWTIDDLAVAGSLVIPESHLGTGWHKVSVVRTEQDPQKTRLYGTTAAVKSIRSVPGGLLFECWSPVAADMVFEHYDQLEQAEFIAADATRLSMETIEITGTSLTIVRIACIGAFTATVQIKSDLNGSDSSEEPAFAVQQSV